MKAFLGAAVAAMSLATFGAVTIGPAEAQVRRYISFQNSCGRPVRLYISHADGYRNWHVHGPYVLAGNSAATRLEANGVTLTQNDNHDLYYYAESVDGYLTWEGGDHTATYSGITYRMRRADVTLTGGWLNAQLTCT